MISHDVIAAISSAVGAAARMIVRISGPGSLGIARSLCADAALGASTACRCRLSFRGLALPITLYTFIAPHSYTGQDLAEFHLPGNPLLARMLLDELLARGARAAEAGEFTARAYFNGRINLAQAEGVAATIAAQNDAELRAARQLLAGELARRLAPAMELVAQTLALVEVGIDFSEEDVSFLSAEQIAQRVARADGLLAGVLEQSARFERLSHEPRIVLVGRPNAGKSTLLNALARRQRAVVSPVAGTTRDVLWAEVALERGIVKVVDVAGLEEESPGDAMAAQMREHALREVRSADAVVWVQEAMAGGGVSGPLSPPLRDHVGSASADAVGVSNIPAVGSAPPTVSVDSTAAIDASVTVRGADPTTAPDHVGSASADAVGVSNIPAVGSAPPTVSVDSTAAIDASVTVRGADPTTAPDHAGSASADAVMSKTPASAKADPTWARPSETGLESSADFIVFSKLDLADETLLPPGVLAVSVHTGQNMDALRRRLDELAFGSPAATPTLALNARHVQAIDEARRALARAAAGAHGAAELLALELREALDALGQVLGNVSPDDLLGRIFSAFCIGK